MPKTKHKFKVGDKVKILPLAVHIGVWGEEVGKAGKIIYMCKENISVKMVNPCKGRIRRWRVYSEHIAIVIENGQQLLFGFMEKLE